MLPLLLVSCLLAACDQKDGDSAAGIDGDGDGFEASEDCHDGASAINPGAEEVPYDGIDNDCDPSTPDDDLDGDGFLSSTDCDDEDAAVHPGADESCNGADDDCDGEIDEQATDAGTYYPDADGDGFGDAWSPSTACTQPSGMTDQGGDCDDGDPQIHPDAQEHCDGVDNDCDGDIDEDPADGDTWYADADGDGHGSDTQSQQACQQPSDHVADAGDCDDANNTIHPGADETCDGVDNDCDGRTDEDAEDGDTWYADTDGDGYGDPDNATTACDQPGDYVADSSDCDDSDAAVNPGASETWYDGTDQDCDGADDYDQDGDGERALDFGGFDCDDEDATINTAASEIWYDGIDQDCDGADDYDADGDGYGTDLAEPDCDDTDPAVYPGAPELDEGVDNDCDGDAEVQPVALADYDSSSSLEHCSLLQLDGSASSDADGLLLSYAWELTGAPSSSTLTSESIEDADSALASCYPDTPGVFSFQLTVTDDGGNTDSDSLSVTIGTRSSNTAPLADAGLDAALSAEIACEADGYEYVCGDCAYEGSFLDASGSLDPDGEPLSYSWTATSGSAVISDPDSATPTVSLQGSSVEHGEFTSDYFVFEVEVTDCYGYVSSDEVEVLLVCEGVE